MSLLITKGKFDEKIKLKKPASVCTANEEQNSEDSGLHFVQFFGPFSILVFFAVTAIGVQVVQICKEGNDAQNKRKVRDAPNKSHGKEEG